MLLFLKSLPYYQPQNLKPKKKKKKKLQKRGFIPKGMEAHSANFASLLWQQLINY